MSLSTRISAFALISLAAGATGYVGTRHLAPLLTKNAEVAQAAGGTFSAGQFSIPVFEDDGVAFILLTQIDIETASFEQQQVLGRNRARVRSTVIETLYSLERRGEILPKTLDPKTVASAVKKDLESEMALEPLGGVLINRLLLQETGRGRGQPAG